MPRRKRGHKWSRRGKKSRAEAVPWEKAVEEIYSSVGSSSALSSNPRLLKLELAKRFRIRNVSVEKISEWLSGQFSHQIHRRAEIKFKRNPVIAPDIDYQWQADLLFLDELGRFNRGFKIALVVVDVVSRFGWAELMKNKTGAATAQAFENILKRAAPRKPLKLQTDNGKEFLNKDFQAVMKKNDITFFTTYSDTKASIAERLIQTVKKLVYKYLNHANTKQYYDVFQQIMDTYNNTPHSSIKMPPANVTKENVGEVLTNLYGFMWETDALGLKQTPKFDVNDYVRVSKVKSYTFRKSYKGNWTPEIFIIDSIKNTFPRVTYGIRDLQGNPIMSSYYENELQKIPKTRLRDQYWEIEKILKIKSEPGGKKKYFVKWVGHDDSHNSWVSADKFKRTPSK